MVITVESTVERSIFEGHVSHVKPITIERFFEGIKTKYPQFNMKDPEKILIAQKLDELANPDAFKGFSAKVAMAQSTNLTSEVVWSLCTGNTRNTRDVKSGGVGIGPSDPRYQAVQRDLSTRVINFVTG